MTIQAIHLDGGEDGFHHYVAISADGGRIAIVWEGLDTSTFARSIHSRVSTNGSANYDSDRVVNVGSGGSPIAGRPQVGISSSGRFMWVWREIRTGTTNDIYAAFADDGATAIALMNEIRLDNDAGNTRDSGFPQLKVVGQNVFVSWQDISTQVEDSDVVFVRSTDNGASFSNEIIIDDPVVEVSKSFTPSMAVDPAGTGNSDDRIFLAWEDRREGTQVYTAVSTDAGASFGTPTRASSSSNNAISGVTRDPKIAYAGNNAVVVAYTNDEGTGTESVFAASSIDGGTSWQVNHDAIDLGAGKSLQPSVVPVTGNGIAHGGLIGWLDFRAGTNINGDPYIRRVGQ